MDFTSCHFPAAGHDVRAAHGGQVCGRGYHTATRLQQPVCGSWHSRGRRAGPDRLGGGEQLGKPPVSLDSQGPRCDRNATSRRDADRAHVAGSAMDGETPPPVHSAATPSATGGEFMFADSIESADRTASEPQMDTICLAGIWRSHLEARGWSQAACERLPLCLADTTHRNYDRYIRDFFNFCNVHGVPFPPFDSAVIADYFLHKCSTLDRPHSTVRCVSAALSALYETTGRHNPAQDPFVTRLTQAIVKSGTRAPMARAAVMDISAFVRLFRSWPDNESLTLQQLRLKTITLLALALMLRPSDIAPLARRYDASADFTDRFVMTTDQLQFTSDGFLQVTFLGIKNDSQRTGFQVTLPPNPDLKLDPVVTLRTYLSRTDSMRCTTTKPMRCTTTKPVFLSLVRPYSAISASTVAQVLGKAIGAAEAFGLAPGHRPKDFRPTSATRAVQLGFDTDDVQRLGRWKTRSVFLEHYVHNKIEESFTKMMFE